MGNFWFGVIATGFWLEGFIMPAQQPAWMLLIGLAAVYHLLYLTPTPEAQEKK